MAKIKNVELEEKQTESDVVTSFVEEEKPDEKPIATLKKTQLDSYDELESYKALRKKRVKKSFVRMVVWLAVIIFIPIFVFFTTIIINPKEGHNFFGYSVYYVTSTSMVGVFDQGDLIVVKSVNNKDDVKIGSDITFVRRSDGETVTHRVIDIIENEHGDLQYITKGFNNSSADPGSVSFHDIMGVRVSRSVVFGDLVEFFRTPYGIVTFLVMFILTIFAINFAFKMSDDIRAVGMK